MTEQQALEALAGPMTVAPSRVLLAAEPACTCGAQHVKDSTHASYCDVA